MNERLPVELKWPGTRLVLADMQAAHEIEILLHLVAGTFAEATIALLLFEGEQHHFATNMRAELEHDRKTEREVEMRLEAQFQCEFPVQSVEYRNALRFEVAREVLRAKLGRGDLPRSLRHRMPFLHAKGFLNASDSIGRLLGRLEIHPSLPTTICDLSKKYYTSFPALREVRNSTQHVEDRGRGLGKGGQRLELKPVDTSMIKAPGGALILDALNGNRFGSTMADGHYGEVEVSASSLSLIRDHIERAFNSFEWDGGPRLEPS